MLTDLGGACGGQGPDEAPEAALIEALILVAEHCDDSAMRAMAERTLKGYRSRCEADREAAGEALSTAPDPARDAFRMNLGKLNAAIAAQEQVAPRGNGPLPVPEEVARFLDGVIGVVEANRFEASRLWREHHDKRTWIEHRSGFGCTVGYRHGDPVCISLLTATVDGHRILFYHPTSPVVDWGLIDAWMVANLPKSAFRSGSDVVNRTDSMNFTIIFPLSQRASSE
ncbi:hypothetical protein [Paracoccus sp. ME4]|uniref:hypothetical protein n=1 Tax=Paracoccus sp. ME4 TaxID=3138066 RepID=UPI00398A50DD